MNSIIVNSIGTASPSVSNILSEAFKLPQEYILKLLYTAPSILFHQVDINLAQKAESILTKLGLDVEIVDETRKIVLEKEKLDISIDVTDPLKLPSVIGQLSSFLGCKEGEALNLLLSDSGIILGGVSLATAAALEKRIDAHVCYSNPQKDLYSLTSNEDQNTLASIINLLEGKAVRKKKLITAHDLSYDVCQKIWKQFRSNKKINIINQSHQKVNLELMGFDIYNELHLEFLNERIGIPKGILPQIVKELPIVLIERMSQKNAKKILQAGKAIGLKIQLVLIEKQVFKIKISNIQNIELVKKILIQFVDPSELPNGKNWESPKEIPFLIANFLLAQLQMVDCQAELI